MNNTFRKYAKKVGLTHQKVSELKDNYHYAKHKLTGVPYYWSDFPLCLQIDISNYCGPKYCNGQLCSYCYPQHKIASGEDYYDELPMEQIEWLIRQFHTYGTRKKSDPYKTLCAEFVTFFLNGDGQTDERLPMVAKKQKQIAPWLTNQTFSCGANPDKSDLLCDSNLDWVCFTVSASNADMYRVVHGGDNFENALKSIRYVSDNAPAKTKLEVHYVITEKNIGGMKAWWNLMGEEFPRFKRVFSGLVDSETNVYSHRAMGKLTLDMQQEAIRRVEGCAFWDHRRVAVRQPCVLWNNAAVNAHGFLLQCCNWADYTQHNYGNIRDFMAEGRSIRDYWMERLANKQRNNLCRNCNLRRPDYKKRLDAMSVNVRLRV